MLGALLAGVLITLFFKFLRKGDGIDVDWFTGIAIAIVPWIIGGVISLLTSYFKWPEWLPLLSIPFYFVVPFYFLQKILEVDLKKSVIYSFVVGFLVLGCQHGLAFALALVTMT